jgi:aspartyl-tRNA(Asn)/glutamyl-tRNA(Gln) amidotransferase subunit B
VSEPDLRSPAEARAYLTALKEILIAAGVSDCSMEEGSLRVDGNISVRRPGAPLGTKTEVKNVNSFSYIEKALEIERARQVEVLESGGKITQITQLYDSSSNTLRTMRSKEDAKDYRNFPDPDLPPLVLDAAWLAARKSELPELPAAKRERFQARYALPAYDAGVLVGAPAMADHFELIVATGTDAKLAANWVMTEAMSVWNETGVVEVSAPRLSALIALVQGGAISHQSAKKVYAMLRTSPDDPKAIAERLGLVQVGDSDQLGAWVDEVLAAFPAEVARYRGGEQKLMGFFTGQVMKKSGGKADPKGVGPLLAQKLGG